MSQQGSTKWLVPGGIMHLPVATYHADMSFDFETNAKSIEFLLRHGADSLCVLMHLAESLNLTVEEKKKITESSIEVVSGRTSVVVHTSMAGTDQVIDLVRHAEKAGADASVVIPPYYWRPSQEAIFEHFSAILSASELPLMGYNSPVLMSGIGIESTTLRALVEKYDHFVGLKEASHNFEIFGELRKAGQEVREDFRVITGIEYMIPALTLGGVGSMSIFGGVAPRLVKNLYDAAVEGRYKEALVLQDKVSALWQIAKVGYPAPIKAMMEIMGRPVGDTRLPIVPLDLERKRSLEGMLDRLGILSSEPYGW